MTKRYRKKDPYSKREAKKYLHPVPSREYIIQYLEDQGKPITLRHLLSAFGISSAEEKEGVRRRLVAMQRDGQLMSNRRGSYALVDQMELVRGRIQGHREGFGFLIPDDGSADIFIPAREMQKVFNDDRVLVRVSGFEYRKRREGHIAEVLQRNTQQVVGRYYVENGIAFVDPDNKLMTQDVIIPSGQEGGAKSGQFVVATIISQPDFRRSPTGKVMEILGDHLTAGMEVELAMRSYNLPFVWSSGISKVVKQFPKTLPKTDYQDRKDLRELPFVTIDGEDAKDFDDAVYCEKMPKGGWKLYVAIADVSHYVKPETELDEEAQLRGNSVYFPAKVIPMLPEALSNELCSLKPEVDRLVMVCEMRVNQEGVVLRSQFYEAVIRSHARLTYSQVVKMLPTHHKNRPETPIYIKELYQLYKQLIKQRQQRGAINFETIETKIIFGKDGKIDYIMPRERNDAHKIIEEAMLLANVTTAKFLQKSTITTLYRVHEGPDQQKLTALRDFLKAFGLRLSGADKPSAMDYARLLARIEKRPDAHLLQTVMLRSLQQAVFLPKNLGHFGLSYSAYTQFTSPIRRYPDVIVHRSLKHIIHNKNPKQFRYNEEQMIILGEHCSMTERRADRAARDATDWLKCDFMMDKVGQAFSGFIADVTGFGVFVELDKIYVQGLLHITSLSNDYYHYDATHHLLRGKLSGKIYRLGDRIQVLVARVDLDQRSIDFELVD